MDPFLKRIKVLGVNGITLFNFNDFTRNLILQVKARNDLELAKHLIVPYSSFLIEKFKGASLVPIPSTNKSDEIRGFNHVVEIFKPLGLEINSILIKKGNLKQAKTPLKQRSKIGSSIVLKKDALVPKLCVIVDDIITSQSSLKAAIRVLQESGCRHLAFIIFANNCRKIEQNKD
jgi:competence protein ComFC